ncbi:MAG TPA: hypothetical protein DF427_11925 [Moraxellaceae bacterium]|nr:hypothetical protein [Moraxellaceae bacterium]
MSRKEWLAISFFAIMLAGCAAPGPAKLYEGALRPAAETAMIRLPEQVQVMALDGQEQTGSLLQRGQLLAVLPGEHVFSLRYVELFQINSEEHEVVRSRQSALRFTAVAGHEYRIEMDKQGSLEVARKFAKDPKFRLVDESSGAVTESTAIKSYAEASLVDTITKAFDSSDSKTQGPTHLDLLKDVWGRASPEDRAGFRVWLDQQPK